MKPNNQILRMQQLAGLITENLEDDLNIRVGDFVESYEGLTQEFKIVKINNNSIELECTYPPESDYYGKTFTFPDEYLPKYNSVQEFWDAFEPFEELDPDNDPIPGSHRWP